MLLFSCFKMQTWLIHVCFMTEFGNNFANHNKSLCKNIYVCIYIVHAKWYDKVMEAVNKYSFLHDDDTA